MLWTEILIPPEVASTIPAPTRACRARTPDARTLEAIVWGDGGQASPLRLLLRLSLPDLPPEEWGEVAPSWRLPTLQELQETINHIAPAGALFSAGTLASAGPDGPGAPELPRGASWLGWTLQQVGAIPGSPAARSSLILEA